MMGADYSTIGTSGKKFQRISPAHAERKIAEGGLGYVFHGWLLRRAWTSCKIRSSRRPCCKIADTLSRGENIVEY